MINFSAFRHEGMSEQGKKAVNDIVQMLDGAPLSDAIEVLDCAKEIVTTYSFYYLPRPSEDKTVSESHLEKL